VGVTGVDPQLEWWEQQQLKHEKQLKIEKKQQNIDNTLLGEVTEVRYRTSVTKCQ
jgi:hypothetical protein